MLAVGDNRYVHSLYGWNLVDLINQADQQKVPDTIPKSLAPTVAATSKLSADPYIMSLFLRSIIFDSV